MKIKEVLKKFNCFITKKSGDQTSTRSTAPPSPDINITKRVVPDEIPEGDKSCKSSESFDSLKGSNNKGNKYRRSPPSVISDLSSSSGDIYSSDEECCEKRFFFVSHLDMDAYPIKPVRQKSNRSLVLGIDKLPEKIDRLPEKPVRASSSESSNKQGQEFVAGFNVPNARALPPEQRSNSFDGSVQGSEHTEATKALTVSNRKSFGQPKQHSQSSDDNLPGNNSNDSTTTTVYIVEVFSPKSFNRSNDLEKEVPPLRKPKIKVRHK